MTERMTGFELLPSVREIPNPVTEQVRFDRAAAMAEVADHLGIGFERAGETVVTPDSRRIRIAEDRIWVKIHKNAHPDLGEFWGLVNSLCPPPGLKS